jgi:photosystem II stability/assembly factor-like uncharacterized protein
MRYLIRVLCLMVGLAAVLLSLFASGLAQGPGQTILYQESFDSGQATGWQLEPGWQVAQDGDNQVLAGEGHHWARPSVSFSGDFRVRFRLKLLRGRIHLVYRMNNAGRYFIGFQEDKSDLSKQYWPDTFQNGLTGSNTAHSLGTWHEIEIAGQGASLRFLVDDQLEWEYTDPDPLAGGSFAFETLDDSQAQVDDIVVYGPDPTPTPTPDRRFTWVRTGGPLGGLGYDVRMRPDNLDKMAVTDAWAGVFVSNDGGQTWLPSNQGITTRTGSSGDAIPVFCLTIDPSNHAIVWAGTQFQRGIFKSTDGGAIWTKMDKGVVESEGITFRGFGVDPHDSDVVYAAAEVSSWTWNGQPLNGREFDMTQGVVYKTTDGGKSWRPVWRGDNLARYVWIDPRDSNVIYVSTGIFDREAANSVPASRTPGGVGILKSVDGGKTWQQINNGLANLYVGTLFMHPQNPDILLAGTGNNQYPDGDGVYLSTDGGASWKQTLRDDNINSVEFAVGDPAIAYAGSSNAIYRSQDGGQTWQRVSGGEDGWGPPGVRAGFPIDFQVDPRDPNRLFANEYGGGNFLSADGGKTWTIASAGYTGAQVRDIAVDRGAAGRVFAAARSGLFVSFDGGQAWAGLSYPPASAMEWTAVALDPGDSQHVLAANNWNCAILESRDAGHTWRQTNAYLDEAKAGWRVIAFAPSDPATVYAGSAGFYSAGTFDGQIVGRGVFISHDGGATWATANNSLMQEAHVTGLAVDPHNPQQVYAATSQGGIFTSADGGRNWQAANQGLPGQAPQALSIAIDPADSKVIYVGLQQAGLYRSADGGATWRLSAAGLNPEASISGIVLNPTNSKVVYAADLNSGVYRSADGGATWQAINTGLRMRAVNALAISADGQHLYAATEGEGVFRLDLNAQPPPAAPTPTPPPISTATSAPPTEAALPSATPSPVEPTPTDTAQASSAQPIPSPTDVHFPTPQPQSKPGICGGAAALPLVLVGMLWSRRHRTR